jgi:hypothetical protein
MTDAEDAVQETYLRWHAAARDRVSDQRAFLMTTTTRICIDMLTSARARREEYVGPWLPEPVVDTAALAPDSRTQLAEDLSIALLLTLDHLSPLEAGSPAARRVRFLVRRSRHGTRTQRNLVAGTFRRDRCGDRPGTDATFPHFIGLESPLLMEAGMMPGPFLALR